MSRTLKERYEAALVKRGATLVKTTPRRVVYTRPDSPGRFFYLGRAGSLRTGATVQGSVPCSKAFKDKLLQEAAS